MHLVIYGPEGSGKGTQANLISTKYNIPVLTSGDLVRQEAVENSVGLREDCKNALLTGQYVSDEKMFILWENRLQSSRAKDGFILDGFPRNLNQANFLFDKVAQSGYSIDRVIFLRLSDEEAFQRLSKRNRKIFAGSTISHDTAERIKSRLSKYHELEALLLQFFRRKNLLLEVDASPTIDEIFNNIVSGLTVSS